VGRRLGSPNAITVDEVGLTKVLRIPVNDEDHQRYFGAAGRAGLTLAEFARRALHEATLTLERYFYVRLPDGTTHPATTEKGYEFIENAKRFANRVNGTVIRASFAPAGTPARNARLDREGLDTGA
jgi:hypothetical protein